jgi:hypothetical protein
MHHDGVPVTSFDEPGAGGGYDLADRFDELKTTMRSAGQRVEIHGSEVRHAVLPQRRQRRRFALRERDASKAALRALASES